MEKILVSACLLGFKVRYNGKDCAQANARLDRWRQEGRLIPFCPELAGGLSVPRPPVEIRDGRCFTSEGKDVTASFLAGARLALETTRQLGIRFALLKEKSPSCGVHLRHDGQFSGHLLAGQGLTCQLLRDNGLQIFSEAETEELELALLRQGGL